MKNFKNYHFDLIKNYINQNEELFQKLATDEFRNNLASEEIKTPHMTEREKRRFLVEQIAASKDVLVRVYALKKYRGELEDLFPNYQINIRQTSECPELACMYDYQASLYEENFEEESENAIAEYALLIENNELWKLFEDENYPEFLMPILND